MRGACISGEVQQHNVCVIHATRLPPKACRPPSGPLLGAPHRVHLRHPADASIWIFQFVKAMRDERGELIRNAHVLGFFRRICRQVP